MGPELWVPLPLPLSHCLRICPSGGGPPLSLVSRALCSLPSLLLAPRVLWPLLSYPEPCSLTLLYRPLRPLQVGACMRVWGAVGGGVVLLVP